ncbi:MAG TPA: cation diffusion facilitator family transporter [Candidatus Xenobia bacterium]|jgi:cation diffusion facilitator family transporter
MDARSAGISRVIWKVLILNAFAAIAKAVTGFACGSLAMGADALHSLMDMSANVMALVGCRWGSQPADEDHPYGHSKFQTLSALGISMLLGVSCFEVLESAIGRLAHPVPPVAPGVAPFIVMFATLVANVWASVYESQMSRAWSSLVLQADAQHTRSDVLTSVSVLASLLGARAGLPWADAAVAVGVAAFLAWTAVGLVKMVSQVLVDGVAVDPREVRQIVMDIGGVEDCHRIRSRRGEYGIWLDLHVLVDPEMSTRQAHEIAEEVERRLRVRYGSEADVMVHIEPYGWDTDAEAAGTPAGAQVQPLPIEMR